MRKNSLNNLLIPVVVIVIVVLYVVFMFKKEGFQTAAELGTSANGCDGAQGEVFMGTQVVNQVKKNICMRLQYTFNGRCTSNASYTSVLYNPTTSNMVNPIGKKICMTTRFL